MNYFKKAFLPLFAIVFVFTSLNISAQEKGKSSLSKKLSELKGKVEKVTVQVDGKDVVFEGKEAQTLAKRMKASNRAASLSYSIGKALKSPRIFTITGEELDDAEVIDEISDADNDIYISVAGKEGLENESKKIKYEKKDGETKLTVTTKDKDGKEDIKVYEGEEAEKFFEDNDIGIIRSSKRGKGRISAFGPGKFWIQKGNVKGKVFIEKFSSDDDDDSTAEIIIQKSDKKLKSGANKKTKKEEIEN